MLKKTAVFSLVILNLTLCFSIIEGASASPSSPNNRAYQNNQNNQEELREKDKIMREDQRESTDIFAIPLDSSEIEDEEELNRLERKKVFDIGH